MKSVLFVLTLASVPFALAAHAGSVTVTPLAGYQEFDDKLDKLFPPGLDNVPVYGGALGYRFAPHWAAELEYLHASPDRSHAPGEGSDNLYSLNGLYRFNPDGRWQPYLLAGVGEQRLKVDNALNSARDSVINAGAGLFYRISDALHLRGELRAVNDIDKRYTDGVALVGLELSFGGHQARPAETVVRAPEPAPVPATPKPMVKWAAAPAAPPSPAPADADHDGVPDTLDKCPGTPAGALVDAQGCPKVITEAIRQEVKVLFDNGKADIKPQYRDEVSKVAELARAYPTAHIEIQGYTDNTGRPAKNVALSQARAEAVRDSLVHDFGVDASRLTAKGFGAAKPLADNKTADGRASNRRVVAVISGERKQVEMKKNRHH